MSHPRTDRWCAVHECKNSSLKTPNKLWIPVPTEINLRKTWLKLGRSDPKLVSWRSHLHFCEDHFDLENDMQNYMEYKIMGKVKRIRLRPFCQPCKFNWKSNSNDQLAIQNCDCIETNGKVSSSCIEEFANNLQSPTDVSSMENKGVKPVQIIHVASHKETQLEKDMENYMQHKLSNIPLEKVLLRVNQSDVPHLIQNSIPSKSNAADLSTPNAQDVDGIAVKIEETIDSDVWSKAGLTVKLDSEQVCSEQCNGAITESSKNDNIKQNLAECEAYFNNYGKELKTPDREKIYCTHKNYLQNPIALDKKKCNKLLPKKRKKLNKNEKLSNNSKKSKPHVTAAIASKPVYPGTSTKLISRMKRSNRAVMYFKECANDSGSQSKRTRTEYLEHSSLPAGLSAKTGIHTELPDRDFRHCIECNEIISGFVFACVLCGVRVCGACDARRHARHYVLRAPAGTPHSELELVMSKIREALSSTQLLPREPAPRVPEVELETEANDVIKMEIKTEEEEYQDLYNNYPSQSQSPSTASQVPLPCKAAWEPLKVSEGTSAPQRKDDRLSTTYLATRTATDPSDTSPSDSEDESLANHPKPTWTPKMNKSLVTLHKLVSQVENRRSRIYSHIKKAFAVMFPTVKVTKSQLEAQRKIIIQEKLVTDQDVGLIANETTIPLANIDDPIETSAKGRSLVLSKVTSGDAKSKIDNTNCNVISTMTVYSHVSKTNSDGRPSNMVKKKHRGPDKKKRKAGAKRKSKEFKSEEYKSEECKSKECKSKAKYKSKAKHRKVVPEPAGGASGLEVSLPPGRGGRARKIPIRLRT